MNSSPLIVGLKGRPTPFLSLLETAKLDFQGLDTPAILNPMRAETVRDEDKEFQDMFKGWKANELDDETFGKFQEKWKSLYFLRHAENNFHIAAFSWEWCYVPS